MADRFFTGKPCKRGHVCERRTSDGGCVMCSRITGAKRNPRPSRGDARERGWKFAGIRSALHQDEFLSRSEFENKLLEQGGCCSNPYCQTPLEVSSRYAHADHCHTTGIFRQVLCAKCNQLEGFIAAAGKDQALWFLSMAAEHTERTKW